MKTKSSYQPTTEALSVQEIFIEFLAPTQAIKASLDLQWRNLCVGSLQRRKLKPNSPSYCPPADIVELEVALLIEAAERAIPAADWVEALSQPFQKLTPSEQLDRIARCLSHRERIAFILLAAGWTQPRVSRTLGLPVTSLQEWIRLRIRQIQSRAKMHDGVSLELSKHERQIHLEVTCRNHATANLTCLECGALSSALGSVLQAFTKKPQSTSKIVLGTGSNTIAPAWTGSTPPSIKIQNLYSISRTQEKFRISLNRVTLAAQMFAVIGLITGVFYGAPYLRKIAFRNLDHKLVATKWISLSESETPAIPTPLPTSDDQSNPPTQQRTDTTRPSGDQEPHSPPGPNELWRFNLRSERARELRNTTAEIIKALQQPNPTAPIKLAGPNTPLQIFDAPGGFQFRLTLPRTRVLELWHQLVQISESERALLTTPKKAMLSQSGKTPSLTWFRNRTQKQMNRDETEIVVWLSYL